MFTKNKKWKNAAFLTANTFVFNLIWLVVASKTCLKKMSADITQWLSASGAEKEHAEANYPIKSHMIWQFDFNNRDTGLSFRPNAMVYYIMA